MKRIKEYLKKKIQYQKSYYYTSNKEDKNIVSYNLFEFINTKFGCKQERLLTIPLSEERVLANYLVFLNKYHGEDYK